MRHTLLSIALVGLCASASVAQVVTFRGLGVYPAQNTQPNSTATAVSSDGTQVFGSCIEVNVYGHFYNIYHGWRWTAADVLQIAWSGLILGASSDGETVVGYIDAFDIMQPLIRAFVWRRGEYLPTGLPGERDAFTAVSAEGTVAVGVVSGRAVRWSIAGGPQDIGMLPGASTSGAQGVSADGTVVVGSCGFVSGPQQAFIWSAAHDMVSLPSYGNVAYSRSALGISADGKTVVGSITLPGGGGYNQPCIWRTPGGIRLLPSLDGLSAGRALATSRDGSVVLGYVGRDSYDTIAYYWDRSRGKRNLQTFLTSLGAIGLNGWTLKQAVATSPDGRFIVGIGLNQEGFHEAWLASIPAFCYANCDNSVAAPALSVADFTCFLNRFAAGDPYTNCDGSTTPPALNIADFVCFLSAFAAGCP
ncbi:MAG: GC-type dockerin domain-anchored protein [Phycisphaerales bacterium]